VLKQIYFKRLANTLKQGILLSLALLFVLGISVQANPDAYAQSTYPPLITPLSPRWQPHMVVDRVPTRRVNNISLRGVFPDITPDFAHYQALNQHISDTAGTLIDSALRLRARTITFSYEVFATHEVVSIVMYASIAAITNREAVATINFHPITGEILTIPAVMGEDFPALVEGILTNWTRDFPETHYAAITAPLTAFYLTHDKLVILFDEFQITNEPGDLTRLELRLERIIRIQPIAPIDYYVRTQIYNLIMVPLKPILHQLGYYATSHDEGIVRIWANPSQTHLISELRLEENHFVWDGGMPRTLESPPLAHNDLHDNIVMVPITFFDRVVPLTTYHVDNSGMIHILAYRAR